MGRTDGLILERISADALREATGRDWDEWLEALDAAGAEDLSHKEIVSHLDREHGDETNSWWRQSIAVGYEQARGENAGARPDPDVGFQVGVQRAWPRAARRRGSSSPRGRSSGWARGRPVAFEEGERYEVPAQSDEAAASGEIRAVKPRERLRLTWQPAGWAAPRHRAAHAHRVGGRENGDPGAPREAPDAQAREGMRARCGASRSNGSPQLADEARRGSIGSTGVRSATSRGSATTSPKSLVGQASGRPRPGQASPSPRSRLGR